MEQGCETHLQTLVCQHSSKVISEFSEFSLTVDRSNSEHFWSSVLSFYKGAIHKPEKLKRCLVVNFENSGEQGYDAGALRKEYFEDSLKEVNERLFEGNECRRIPKKDISLELVFQVAGMIFAHSVLQGGPAMPCLSPVVFEFLIHGDTTKCLPLKDDIPLNMSTHELITAIEEVGMILKYTLINIQSIVVIFVSVCLLHIQLDKTNSNEEIDAVLENPSIMAIVNRSRWGITEMIRKSNKSALLQQLIWEEVVARREDNMMAFRRGISILGMIELFQRHPVLTRPLLVTCFA